MKSRQANQLTSKPATHPCGCFKADGSAMVLAESMASESPCCCTDTKGWECGALFPREHVRKGDSTSKLYARSRCLKHRKSHYSSAAASERHKAAAAVYDKKKQGTEKEKRRQTTQKAKQLNRPLPTGDLRLRTAPCATLSMLTYYRTSRSLHFPFSLPCWAAYGPRWTGPEEPRAGAPGPAPSAWPPGQSYRRRRPLARVGRT